MLAAGLFRARPEDAELERIRSGLWVVAGLLPLFGVTGELRRYFRLEHAEDASLASGLAVSAWWLMFAAALVTYGFRRA